MKLADLNEAFEPMKHEVLYKHLNPRREASVKTALDWLEAAVAGAPVYNVEFGENKDILSGSLDWTLDAVVKAEKNHDELWDVFRAHYDISSSYVQLNQAAKQVRELNKVVDEPAYTLVRPTLLAMRDANEAAVSVKKSLDSIKDRIIKGRRPSEKPVDPNAFHRVLGSKASQDKVKDALLKVISPKLTEYAAQMTKFFQGYIDRLVEMGAYEVEDSRHADQMTTMIISQCFTSKRVREGTNGWRWEDLKLTEKGKTFAADEAEGMRASIEQQFIYKNQLKLSKIVDLKGNLKEIKELRGRAVQVVSGVGTIEAGLEFIFDDKARFTVINKIVSKYSIRGKSFNQFPTTFHDVVFPDGTKMKMPSEEKMVKEFPTTVVTEATKSLTTYIDMLNDVGVFMTLNTMKLNAYGKDPDAGQELNKMMRQFRQPVLNGKTFTDLLAEVGMKTVKDPKVIPHLLKWVYQFLQYVTPRIDRYCNDQGRSDFKKRISQLSDKYRRTVHELS